MNNQFLRAGLLSFVFLLFATSFFQKDGIAQSSSQHFEQNVKHVNGYKVAKGERPPIDLATVPADAFEKGKIYVKFNSAVKHLISDNEITTTAKGHISTGLQKFDDYCIEYGITGAKQSISSLYKNNSKGKSYRMRHEAWGLNLWYELSLGADEDIKKAVSELQELPEVEFAEPVYKIRLIGPVYKGEIKQKKSNNSKEEETWAPNDEFYKDNQWHYNNTGSTGTKGIDIDLERAWALEKGNSSVIVAVMDGGIDYKHPDLNANMWDKIGPDGVITKPCKQNHGTHVGGTVAAVSNNGIGVAGVAGGSGDGDGVRLMSLDIFEGSHGLNDMGLYIYSADNGAAISQNSWGYKNANVYNQSALDGIDYFTENGGGDALLGGGLVIFAAGNDDDSGNWYPGCYPPAMAVASHNSEGKKSSFSNSGDWVDITAPGSNIYSTANLNTEGKPPYMWMSGTSMACPHVSGVAALVVSYAYGKLTRTKLWNVLQHGVDDVYIENPSRKGKLGSGRLNAYKALLSIPDFTAEITILNENRVPIKDLEIKINDTKYYSNSEGKIILKLMYGNYAYEVNTEGYVPTKGTFTIVNSNVIVGIEVPFDNNIVDFTIVNESRVPIKDAEVIVNDTKYVSNSEGKVTLILSSGSYTYEVNASGYISTANKFSVVYSGVNIGIVLLSENNNYPIINGVQNVCTGSRVFYSIHHSDKGTFEVENGEVSENAGDNIIFVNWTDGINGKVHFRSYDQDGFVTTVTKAVNIDNLNKLVFANRPTIVKKGSIPILICKSPDLQYKWFINGEEVSGEIRQDYAPRGLSGNFRVQTIDNNQCPSTSDGVEVTSMPTSEIEFNVFPNPTNNVFNVSLTSESIGNGVIIISNSYGKIVFQETITKNDPRWEKRYQLSGLIQGIYVVKIVLNNSITTSSRVTVY